jgi:hypothetical protein
VVPSIETADQCSIKEEPHREGLEREGSSATLVAFSDLSTQLEEFAGGPEQPSNQRSTIWPSPPVTQSPSSEDSYTSDVETQPSPCVRETRAHSYEDMDDSPASQEGHRTTPPVNRRLDFSAPKSAQEGNRANEVSLKDLHSIEKSPRHNWSDSERELLCVLYRYYKAETVDTIPIVFNHVTNLNLRHRIIQAQFDHVRLYGPRAYISYRRVFSAPFDRRRHYHELRKMIDTEAASLGVRLERQTVEPSSKAGMAAFSRSPTIRRQWKIRVRMTSQRERDAASRQGNATTPSIFALNEQEVFTDAEDAQNAPVAAVETIQPVPKLPRSGHHLAFRTWCDDTR